SLRRTLIPYTTLFRSVPPSVAPMLMSAQKPAPSFGRNIASSPPSAPPIISSGASTPPEVPEPSDTAQMNHLTISTPKMTFVETRSEEHTSELQSRFDL